MANPKIVQLLPWKDSHTFIAVVSDGTLRVASLEVDRGVVNEVTGVKENVHVLQLREEVTVNEYEPVEGA